MKVVTITLCFADIRLGHNDTLVAVLHKSVSKTGQKIFPSGPPNHCFISLSWHTSAKNFSTGATKSAERLKFLSVKGV